MLVALAFLGFPGCGSGSGSQGAIPPGTLAYQHPEYWPYAEASSNYPFLVHYRVPEELAMVRRVIECLDAAWKMQIVIQGYTPPPSDAGLCGPDGRFDVFIWRGINTCEVDKIGDAIVTPWGGRASFMKLDPWGTYGGDSLAPTVAHEFNHATHAANDWDEIPIAFEMSASYVEQFYGPVEAYSVLDFQSRPDWGLLRDDKYKTWYMYGSALYLHFLRDHYFNGDDGFLPELWVAVRNLPPDFKVNKPHFVDGINAFLNPRGSSFLDSVVGFARWRYYAGWRDDGAHFRRLPTWTAQHAFLPEATLVIPQLTLAPLTREIVPAPMLTGSAYLEIKRANETQTSFQVSINAAADPALRWVVQAVPGLSPGQDGDLVDLGSGSVRIPFNSSGKRTLILTALPVSGFDPNHQTDTRYPVSLTFAP
jgi:hypothetical protein